MATIYKPIIVTRIPADIPAAEHPSIEAKLETARLKISNRNSYNRDAALDIAARAIFHSGVSACAYPDVKPTKVTA